VAALSDAVQFEPTEPREDDPQPIVRLVALPPEREAELHAAAKVQAARDALLDVVEDTIHSPTRAELVLAFLWAAVLAPVLATPVGFAARALIGEKGLTNLAKTIAGPAPWPFLVLGTAFVMTFVVQVVPKARARRLADARVLVFERGRSLGPSILLLVVLVELGIWAALGAR
jgi:hypothetical protein